MTGETVTVNVVSRSGRDMGSFTLSRGSTVQELKQAFAVKHSRYYPERQWFTIGEDPNKVVLKSNSARLSEFAPLANGGVVNVTFKDLGPQIAWRTVFQVEYFGPILFHSICFFLPRLVYGQKVTHNYTQTAAFSCVLLHYVKREYESVFVHRFSNGTMPAFNIVKNSFHYWILGGLNIAYFLYHPQYTGFYSNTVVNACVVVFLLAELGNLDAHITLRDLRPEGTTARAIPRGGLFGKVCCANYTYELLAWLAFCIFTRTLTGYLFLIVSTVQIAFWSLKKHQNYKREFGKEYTSLRRNILFPFIW